MKEEMQAVIIESFGGVDKLKMTQVPKPIPEDNEVCIDIEYTSVNPVDWKIREGMFKGRMPYQFPLIPGWDASGKISAKGKNVTKFEVGDAVYAYCKKPVIQWGTYAECICVEENHVALKPKNISFAEAAAIPLTALTAWQALFDVGKLKKGDKILIHAGAGGVGGFAIQFAKNFGADVFATASAQNHEYLKKLGCRCPIDYHKEHFGDVIKKDAPEGIDFVLDTIGGKTLTDSLSLIKKGGQIVSIVEQVDAELCNKKEIHSGYVFVRPDGKELSQIGKQIEEGKILVPRIEEMDLSEASKAQEKNREGHTIGKIVLKVGKRKEVRK